MSQQPNNDNNDAFLSSMTFANAESCACDECDNGSDIPPEILRALRAYQNKRKSEQAVTHFGKRSRVDIVQRRELMERFGGVSLWKLTLPAGNGDPIVEYRNSHRIVFVQCLPRSSAIFSIGKGIIGSAAEENDRKPVQWEQGSAYYLQCIKGLACGWVHKQQRDSEGKSVEAGDQIQSVEAGDRVDTDVTLYIFKAPPEAIHDVLSEDAPAWVKCMTEQFLQLIGSNETKCDGNNTAAYQLENTSTDGYVPEGILLPVEDSIKISGIVEQIVGSNAKSPGHLT